MLSFSTWIKLFMYVSTCDPQHNFTHRETEFLSRPGEMECEQVRDRKGNNQWHEPVSSSYVQGSLVFMTPECWSERGQQLLWPETKALCRWFSWPNCHGDSAAPENVSHGLVRHHFSCFGFQVCKSVGLVREDILSFTWWWFKKPLWRFKSRPKENWILHLKNREEIMSFSILLTILFKMS